MSSTSVKGHKVRQHEAFDPKQRKHKTKILVHLKNTVMYPSSSIDGWLELEAEEDLPLLSLRLKIVGKEQVITHLTGKTKSAVFFRQTLIIYGPPIPPDLLDPLGDNFGDTQKQRLFANRKEFIEATSSVYNVKKGKYCYPFRFYLPKRLPSSFLVKNRESTCSIEVSYLVKGIMLLAEEETSIEDFHCFDVINAIDRGVYENGFNPPVKPFTDILSHCCCGKSIVLSELKLSAEICALDHHAINFQIRVDLKNCKMNLLGAELQLINEVSMFNAKQEKTFSIRRVLCKKNVVEKVLAAHVGTLNVEMPLSLNFPPTVRLFHAGSTYCLRGFLQFEGKREVVLDDTPIDICQTVHWQYKSQQMFPVTAFPAPLGFFPCTEYRVNKKKQKESNFKYSTAIPSGDFLYRVPPQPCVEYRPFLENGLECEGNFQQGVQSAEVMPREKELVEEQPEQEWEKAMDDNAETHQSLTVSDFDGDPMSVTIEYSGAIEAEKNEGGFTEPVAPL